MANSLLDLKQHIFWSIENEHDPLCEIDVRMVVDNFVSLLDYDEVKEVFAENMQVLELPDFEIKAGTSMHDVVKLSLADYLRNEAYAHFHKMRNKV